MDQEGFRDMLRGRKVPDEKIKPAIALAERFEAFLKGKSANAENAWAFSKVLIAEGSNTYKNYVTLIRYCRFIKNDEMFITLMELVDGSEVSGNFHRKVGEAFGEKIQKEVFEGFGITLLEASRYEKARYMQTTLGRLEDKVGGKACKALLSDSLRDLPDSDYASDQQGYIQCKDIDEYLKKCREDFLADLEACKRDNLLHFTQEVTDEVIDFLRSVCEIRGVRQGNVVYEVKEPYQTKQYLAATDPVMKRYYACHCPWAREAIKHGHVKPVATFCACSAGYHKRRWEVIFGQKLKAEVIESVLWGDTRCRFAIHLPEEGVLGI